MGTIWKSKECLITTSIIILLKLLQMVKWILHYFTNNIVDIIILLNFKNENNTIYHKYNSDDHEKMTKNKNLKTKN